MKRWRWIGWLSLSLWTAGCGDSGRREPDFSHFADPAASPSPAGEALPTADPSPTPRPRSSPPPDLSDAVRAPAEPSPAPTPEPTRQPTPTPAPVATPTPQSTTAPNAAPTNGGEWVVQLGAFGSKPNADRLVARMRAAGETVTLVPTTTDPPTYRVRAGSFTNRTAAQTEAARLRSTYTDVPATVVSR